ncbi:hypothetical protein MMC34_002338 [Xylographa carneopallida]|nr:hypothetical protein [Xylographa carneopallida]
MLSSRGAQWAKVEYLHGKVNVYNPIDNPDGIVSFINAENVFMHDDLAQFINTHNLFDKQCCAYGEGYTGTLRLRTAMAKHLNAQFRPVQAIDPEEVTFAAGVTDLNEVCAMVTCDPERHDSIMLGMPIYGPFAKDLVMRTGVKLEYVAVGDTDQFSPACVAAYEAGFEAAKALGVDIRALIICNPHNPLGKCYPPETLVALLRLCAAKGIHLISDEIYALSVYNRDDRPAEEFTSIRSIDSSGIIDPRQVHVLYGMSKDYGAAGLRLGCVISQNLEFSKATRAICRFSSPSQFSMDLAAKFLEDRAFVTQFLQKSRHRLLQARLLAENLLTQAEIDFHQNGNAGLFIWVDLAAYLPLEEASGDGWATERALCKRFERAGVLIDAGEGYHTPYPGRFRLMFCVEERTLREGIRRSALSLV